MKLLLRILALLTALTLALSAPNPLALAETRHAEEETVQDSGESLENAQDSASAEEDTQEDMTAGETETQAALRELSETPGNDLLTLATLVLRSYALLATYPEASDVLPTDLVSLLDLDFSGTLGVGDSYILLTWYSLASIGMLGEEEATVFMAQYDAFFGHEQMPETEPLETTAPVTSETTATTWLYTTKPSATTETTAAATTETTATTTAATTVQKTTKLTTTRTTATTIKPSTTTRTTATTTKSSTTTRTTATTTSGAATTTTPSTTTHTDVTTTSAAATTQTSTTSTTIVTTATTAGVTTVPGGAWASKSSYSGIDVSKWQGEIDWEKVADDGVEFAMIRAGYGKWSSNIDAQFAENMEGAHAAGIACGAYWYSYAETAAEAQTEANCFLNAIEGYQFEYPLAFDIEDEIHMNLTETQISAIIEAFCSVLEDAGYYVCVYSYGWFLSTMVSDTILQTYDVWVAHTGVSAPSYSKTSYGIWQYSHTSSFEGITGDVDADYSYKCYPRIMERAGLNGF